MTTIAWTRLTFFVGSSILLLSQLYIFMIEILTFAVIAPALFSILQYLVQLSLCIGFITLTLSYYRLYCSSPPPLDTKNYNPSIIKNLTKLSAVISLTMFVLLLIPPTLALADSVRILFSGIVIILWTIYYILLSLWILNQWLLSARKHRSNIMVFLKEYILVSHITLTIILGLLWLSEGLLLLVFQIDLFSLQIFNMVYIMILLVFSIHHIIFLFKTTRFSYVIIG